MQGNKIQKLVYELAQPVVEGKGMELVGVEYVKEGASWYLRLYIDKEGGVDLEDCQAVSVIISDLLDEKDPIPQAYFLEVSSPGIERVIQTEKDFIKYKGREVNVHTYTPVEKQKIIRGTLSTVDEEFLNILLAGGKELKIPRQNIAQVKLAWID